MSGQDKSLTKKRGRPAGVKHGEFVGLRLPSDLANALDAWASSRPEPQPSRSEAIRRLVERALAAEGVASATVTAAALEHQISKAEAAIAAMSEHAEPSPEAALAAMDKAIAENDLVRLKNKRMRRANANRN
jgi:hypothetical protein